MSFKFDATQVAPDQGSYPIPEGHYRASITKTNMKPTKSGLGLILALEFTILGGEFNNRRIYSNINIINQNETCQRIGQGQLSAICHAIGVMCFDDTQLGLLHNRPLNIGVGIEIGGPKGDGTMYANRNNITGYSKEQATVQPAINIPASPTIDVPQPWQQTAPIGNPPTANSVEMKVPSWASANPVQTEPSIEEINAPKLGANPPWVQA
jgi:hypothetical protein